MGPNVPYFLFLHVLCHSNGAKSSSQKDQNTIRGMHITNLLDSRRETMIAGRPFVNMPWPLGMCKGSLIGI